MLVQHLCRRQVEIFLRHMNPSFAQGIHARFGADTFKLGARAAIHFLGDLSQVDSSRKIHAAAVNAEDVGASLDAGYSIRKEVN